MALPAVERGVRQVVYLPVHRVLTYRGSLYAKPISGPAAVEVSLRKHDPVRPTAVTPHEATAPLAGGSLEWMFPHSSITRIGLRR